jgi:hypothetical protein
MVLILQLKDRGAGCIKHRDTPNCLLPQEMYFPGKDKHDLKVKG